MALTDGEVYRIKAELGFNVLTVGAEPYIGVAAVFNRVIQPFMSSGAATTSATAVTAASVATPVTLTLGSGTGFSANDRVVVDVDDRQEIATVQTISGASLTVMLRNAHSGTYPVTVEGGETIVREYLRNIREVKDKMRKAWGAGVLKAVDEIQFYEARGQTFFGALGEQLRYWRDQLAAVLGITSAWSMLSSGAARVAVY